jgi:site-specific DNA recombinase
MGDVVPIQEPEPARLRAVIYLRVSTAEQAATDYGDDGYSIQAQAEACKRAAERLGADVVDEYVDRGKSARSADRPQLQAMLRRLSSQKDIDFVIVHKIDRLARNRADDIQIVLAIRKAEAQLISATENIDETPSGTLLHAIMAAVAEFYSGNLAQEAKKGMQKKAELGGTPGNAPIGYLNTRDRIDGKDIGIVVLDPERADHVRWAFREFALGALSVRALSDALNGRGMTQRATARNPERPLRTSTVHRMLRNRYYLGLVTFNGVEHQGRHEPLADELTFQLVQEVLTGRNKSKDKPQKHDHPLKAVLHCGKCGRRLGLMWPRGRSGVRYPYFFCLGRQERPDSCDQPLVRAERVESAVLRLIGSYRLNLGRRTELRSLVRQWFLENSKQSETELQAQQVRIHKLKRRRDKVKEAYLADALDIGDLKTEQQRIGLELLEAETLIQRHVARLSDVDTGIDSVLALLTRPRDFYANGSDGIRRLMVLELFDKIWIVDDRVAGVDLRRPFGELLSFEAAAVAFGNTRDQGSVILARSDSATWHGRDPYLRRERPGGPLPFEHRTPTSVRVVDGSKMRHLVGLRGLEPLTSSLSGKRSNRLSYRPGDWSTSQFGRRPERNITSASNGHPKPHPRDRDGQGWSSARVTSMPPSSEEAML